MIFGLAVTFFQSPSQYPFIVLLYFSFVAMTVATLSLEMALIFASVIMAIELCGMGWVSGQEKAWLAGHIVLIWTGLCLARLFSARGAQDEARCSSGLREGHKTLLGLQKEKEFLTRRLAELSYSTSLDHPLSHAVRQLAGLLDPLMVRQRLMELARSLIDRGTIHLYTGNVPRDPMDHWVMEQKRPLLVTDLTQDRRFLPLPSGHEVRSVLAAPMVVGREWVGLIRLNGFEPSLFSIRDLRILEILAHWASLALENLRWHTRVQEGAIRDPLTALYTPRYFQERLAEEILRAGRYQKEFSLLLFEVDDFKRYNDTYGHAAGDQVWVRLARLLQQTCRAVDMAARFSEEKFAVILPQTSLPHARDMADQIRQTVSVENFTFGPETPMQEHVTLSGGLAVFPHDATTTSQLVRAALERLLQAKEAGQNRIVA